MSILVIFSALVAKLLNPIRFSSMLTGMKARRVSPHRRIRGMFVALTCVLLCGGLAAQEPQDVRALLGQLNSKDRDVAKSARLTLQARGAAIVPELVKVIESEGDSSRLSWQAWGQLRSLGPKAVAALPMIESMLPSNSTQEYGVLTAIGEAAVPLLLREIEREQLRGNYGRALRSLKQIAKESDLALHGVFRVVLVPRSDRSRSWMYGIKELGDRAHSGGAAKALCDLVLTGPVEIRKECLRRLVVCGVEAVTVQDQLIAWLGQDDAARRDAAIGLLGLISAEHGVGWIEGVETTGRAYIPLVLGHAGAKGVDSLLPFLADPSPELRWRALRACQQIGEPVIAALRKVEAKSDDHRRALKLAIERVERRLQEEGR